MSKIKIDNLKSKSLSSTGELIYGLPEYVYIKSFNYDDNNTIKVQYYVLLKTSETEFDMITPPGKTFFEYTIADGKPFIDNNGYLVYKKDENGEIMYEYTFELDEEGNETDVIITTPVKRLEDFTKNYNDFADIIIPAIFIDIKNHRGYHPNKNGEIDNNL